MRGNVNIPKCDNLRKGTSTPIHSEVECDYLPSYAYLLIFRMSPNHPMCSRLPNHFNINSIVPRKKHLQVMG